jgi:hypothetical protein
MKFELDDDQVKHYYAWSKQTTKLAIEKQKAGFAGLDIPAVYQECWDAGYPYGGAIGGAHTFSFTHTSLGTICKVKDAITDQELDLTDYGSW